ncbi:MAG TPA: UDP-N-acetylmuramoyl-L-alanyl-D-glutamate--2,6-diaminopimelate ligase, partial [Chlamydiales bacterium]|nr:UDP-N-acetylmuramoyl-L-alanyl-D-glutamate--2,6-diaminopimelate ligase [Chlamydiales bacterium]
GITGTSGKTTVSYAVRHIFQALNLNPGLIGTIEYSFGTTSYPAQRTTPDVITNHKYLKEMVRHGAQACVMEVTSHALTQKRVAHIEYDIAVFTNLTHEHLDYHKTMNEYFASKLELFASLVPQKESIKDALPKVAIINADSNYAERIIAETRVDVLTYGIEKKAHLMGQNIRYTPQGTHFLATFEDEKAEFFWPLVGRFNVSNALAAIAVGLCLGLSLQELAPILQSFKSAPGRLEKVENKRGLHIYVDYAHKMDALQNVLSTLQECKKDKGKLITVFGCGGDRDKEKRPMMAKVAEEFSDVVIITSDNPRSEKPETIVEEICSGFTRKTNHFIELDRKQAIAKAIDMATSDDLILIAGKGHETKQEFAHHIIDFDDRIVAQEYCSQPYCAQKFADCVT